MNKVLENGWVLVDVDIKISDEFEKKLKQNIDRKKRKKDNNKKKKVKK